MSDDIIRNGVNLTEIENLLEAIEENPELANVVFKAKSEWVDGTQAKVSISDLIAGGNNMAGPDRDFSLTVDEPTFLGGKDEHPNPVEYLAAALCGCITAGISTNAALFETELEKIDVEVDVNFDVKGVLGLDENSANGALSLDYKVTLKGSDKEGAIKSKETIDRKSPVKNTIELPLKISTEIEYED